MDLSTETAQKIIDKVSKCIFELAMLFILQLLSSLLPFK